MKLMLNKNHFTNPNYQKIPTYNANNVLKPRDILEFELYDEDTKQVFTIKTLLESYEQRIEQLTMENKNLREDLDNKTKRLLEIINALKEEVREGGIL